MISREPVVVTERLAVIGAFLLYLIVQFHASAYHGYWGQDWLDHKNWIAFAANHPWAFITHYAEGRTNPPLFHLLGAAVKHAVGPGHYLVALGVVNVTFGFVGACFLYSAIRRLIGSPLLRVACIVFILFLPFAMIHAQVIASDALATPLYCLLLWLVVRFRADGSTREFAGAIISIALVIMVGVLAKFTFASAIPAAAAWAFILWWTRVLSARRLVLVLTVVAALPTLLAYKESVRFRSGQTSNWGIHWPARLSDANMNPRSILWLRAADRDVLAAPAYNWKVDGKFELLISNKHSFPALLHLGMFTDLLNIYQFDPFDQYFGQRTERNHRRMQLAVLTAVALSAFTLIAVITLLIRSFVMVLVRREPRDFGVPAVLLFSFAWFVNIVAAYPLVADTYLGGFWLPRLLAPALLGFFVLGFVFLDRLRWQSKPIAIAVMIAVIIQSALHLSFLWPHRSDDILYEPDSGVVSAASPTLRVLSWQDSRLANQSGEYWLEKTVGIIINRPPGSPKMENWSLRFTIRPGPSSPTTRGTLRISSRHFGPQLVAFDGETQVQLDVPVSAGRNEIVFELVSPDAVERADDPSVRMAQVSRIEVRPPGAASALPISQ